jgi:hypothetical protein
LTSQAGTSLKQGREPDDIGIMASRMLNLRRDDVCCECGCALPAGSRARWDAARRTVTCVACVQAGPVAAKSTEPELDRGRPGASAAREYQRRRHNREARTRKTHPRIGGLLLALGSTPQHELAFHQGELGETVVAAYLEKRLADWPAILLHDRRMPRGRGNIDHLAIAPTGVYVIDVKNLHGKVRVASPLFGSAKLLVNGRNHTKLVDGLDRQVRVVRDVLATHADVPVQGVLCFTSSADLPLLGLKMREHLLVHRRALAKKLGKAGQLPVSAIDTITRALAASLPPA